MAYLRLQDYKTYIQGSYLKQLVQDDQDKRVIEELASIQTIAGYLKAKFDLDAEFTDTLPYDKRKTYGAGNRVTVDVGDNAAYCFSLWVSGNGYSVGDLAIYNGYGYVCTSDNTDVTFDPDNWNKIAAQYTIFHARYPDTCTLRGEPNPPTLMNPYAPVFNYLAYYFKDDVVFWKGNTYVAACDSAWPSHQADLQVVSIQSIPPPNIFPDDPIGNKNNTFWKNKTAYVIEPNTPLTDTTAWAEGDNRNQIIKDMMVAFTVFRLSSLITPAMRPEDWKKDFIGYKSDLKMYASGEMSLNLPLIQPRRGLRTVGGGDVKKINNW